MISIRYEVFETNSSSTMTFCVSICQVDDISIPPVVKIDSNGRPWDKDLNGCYARAGDLYQEKQFLGLLKHIGVKDIFVDGKPVDADPEDREVTFATKEEILAMCFGYYKSFSEWMGHGDEWDQSQFLTKEQIKAVQTHINDPKYVITCKDDSGNEVPWESTPYSKMHITDEEIEAEREYFANRAKYDADLDSRYDDSPFDEDIRDDEPVWEDDNFYVAKQNRRNKNDKGRKV